MRTGRVSSTWMQYADWARERKNFLRTPSQRMVSRRVSILAVLSPRGANHLHNQEQPPLSPVPQHRHHQMDQEEEEPYHHHHQHQPPSSPPVPQHRHHQMDQEEEEPHHRQHQPTQHRHQMNAIRG